MTNLLTPQMLHDYQRECVMHQLQHDDSMLWLGMGLGKEQPNSEPVLTPKGWVPMGALRPGDFVIGMNGDPTEIVNVYPQGVKDVLTIKFSDGFETRCGWDHVWSVKTNHDVTRGKPWRKMTTRELVESGLKQGDNSKYIIPMCRPVQYPERDLPLNPYTLGVILGDGSVSESDGVTVCTDTETLLKCKATAIKPHETSSYTSYGYIPNMKHVMRDLDLMGKRSWEKHVPESFMRASIDQRLSLLQGLLDTDGSPITKGGGVEFSSTSEYLTDAVVELTQSLGGVARKKGPRVTKHQGGNGRPSWRVNVKLPCEFEPFTLKRKLDKWVRPTKYLPQRRIRDIVSAGYREHSTCISVAADDCLYLTRNHIVTHNTPVTLTTIVDRMRAGQVQKTLIFGPLRVIQAVWAREARKWSHTKHLRFSVVHGNKEKRTRALFADADIYLINYEAMNWLSETLDHYYLSQGKELPFQMVVYDEVSKLKNSTTLRMAGGTRDRKDRRGEPVKVKVTGWRKILKHFRYRTGLTGTPASNGYLDLHGQFLAVDGGERLGEYITHYKDSYFTSDYNGWNYAPTELGKQWIEYKISDITKKMDAKDYLDLPDCKVTNLMVDLPATARKAYADVEKHMFTQLDSGKEVEVFSRSSVSNKCLQFCLAEGTEVLTDSGWKPIEQFQQGDKVWDGDEWVSVHSLAFQGVKGVIELDGVWMTPDHKVLTKSGWKESQTILENINDERFDRVEVRLPNSIEERRVNQHKIKTRNVVGPMYLWQRICGNRSEPSEQKQTECEVMWLSTWGGDIECDRLSWNDENTSVHRVDKHEVKVSKPEGQRLSKLWRSWGRSMRRVVRFIRSILGRHGRYLSGAFIHRACGQQWSLQQAQLPMGYSKSAVEQQAKQSLHQHTNGQNDGDTSSSTLRIQRCDIIRQDTQRLVGKTPTTPCRVEKTYDLINAGRRNRFTVRGKDGQIFIAHNCNGSPYLSSDSPEYEALHDAKLDALDEVLEEAGGSPVLCSYTFKADAERIMKKFKKYKPVNLTAARSADTERIINDWNRGKIKLMIGHPASMGHGVDGLQDSGHILVWFGLNWSLELYEQMNGRINRQGQKHPVSLIRILCNDTIDLAVADALERKTDDQEGLKAALQRYRDGITTNDLEVNFF